MGINNEVFPTECDESSTCQFHTVPNEMTHAENLFSNDPDQRRAFSPRRSREKVDEVHVILSLRRHRRFGFRRPIAVLTVTAGAFSALRFATRCPCGHEQLLLLRRWITKPFNAQLVPD
jgi:hypothetical protein